MPIAARKMRRQKWLSQLRQQTLRFKSKRPVCTVLTGRRESLNEHVHFHVCVVDGVLEEGAGNQASPPGVPGVIFHPASAIDEVVVQEVQATLRRRILRALVGRGLLQRFEAKAMLSYKHSGFSVDTSVRIAAHDRAGLERLLRYCVRPAFSMERLRKAGSTLATAGAHVARVKGL